MDYLYAIWLLLTLGPGNKYASMLCEYYSSFEEIYKASRAELSQHEWLPPRYIEKMNYKNLDSARKAADDCEIFGIDMVTFYDVQYPSGLKNIPDFPVMLFVKGKLPKQDSLCISIVGSRKPSVYGTKMADRFSYELSKAGLVIVSGLARGIDSIAHRGTLRADAVTIAVLGCGLDVVYPPENKDLMDFIQQKGAVISEFVPGTPPLPAHFPVRNRIVSGLSDAILVIEGKASSGSRITANLAHDQGREVFCLPGNIDNPLSAAPNSLIREGARIVLSPEDILIDMAVDNPQRLTETIYSDAAMEEKNKSKLEKLTQEQKRIIKVLDKCNLTHIDELCYNTGIEIAVVNQCLFILEMEGLVKQLPGKYYILCN